MTEKELIKQSAEVVMALVEYVTPERRREYLMTGTADALLHWVLSYHDVVTGVSPYHTKGAAACLRSAVNAAAAFLALLACEGLDKEATFELWSNQHYSLTTVAKRIARLRATFGEQEKEA